MQWLGYEMTFSTPENLLLNIGNITITTIFRDLIRPHKV